MLKHTLTRIYGTLVVVLVLAGALVAVALAMGSQSATVRSASNSTLKTNVVVRRTSSTSARPASCSPMSFPSTK